MKKMLDILVWPVILAPLVYLAISWSNIPETVALHFQLDGTPDRFGNKKELIAATAILAAVGLGVYLLLKNIYRIDPKKYAAENKERLQRMGFATAIFISVINAVIIYSAVAGKLKFDIRFVFGGIGALWCILGNYLHTIKPNYFAGFRLPWTLNNEENWRRTHLMAGKLWFGGGLLLFIICVLGNNTIAIVAFIVITLITTILPVVYSYKLYKASR